MGVYSSQSDSALPAGHVFAAIQLRQRDQGGGDQTAAIQETQDGLAYTRLDVTLCTIGMQ